MCPKSFIQFHQEGTKILQVQVRCPDTDRETEKQTDLVPEVAPPEVVHLKKIKLDTDFPMSKLIKQSF